MGWVIQRRLSEYLQCELYHSLGAYHVAEERLAKLGDELRLDERHAVSRGQEFEESQGDEIETAGLLHLVDLAKSYNHKLGWYRYASSPKPRTDPERTRDSREPSWPARDPLPDGLPLTNIDRFGVGFADASIESNRNAPWSSEKNWDRVPRFYSEAIAALEMREAEDDSTQWSVKGEDVKREESNRRNFALSLITPRDGIAEKGSDRAAEIRLARRLKRYKHRRKAAHDWLAPAFSAESSSQLEDRYPVDSSFLGQIVGDDLSIGNDSLPMFVVAVQAEAHLSMHAVEAWRSMCLGEHANTIGHDEREWLNRELERSIALSTFAYCAGRTVPWIFAKDPEERIRVFSDVSKAWENVVPVRCMWIAEQVSLLALHRRAYARSLKGESEQAYNDYHKLQQLIRDTERRVRAAPIHTDGALEFLAGLNAEAHHHIGELYRSAHAYKPALEHFEAATHRLADLRKDETVDEVLSNSRWYVELKISHGKACYEMGRHKEALGWHLRAWHAFLELLASETETEINADAIEEAILWLDGVKFEPELRKSDISDKLRPVVDQLDRINTVGRVGALAAEILLRLGHLLFVLNVGTFDKASVDKPQDKRGEERAARARIRRTLGFACLVKACECDPHSTLVGADLLKARFRFDGWFGGELGDEYKDNLRLPTLMPISEHWPRGGDDYERLARVAEYMMLKARIEEFDRPGVKEDRGIKTDSLLARDLLLSLFMSTDSINVRKSQIHKFLTKKRDERPLPGHDAGPSIEFICMRRYSSPFPLLPRPSAFRALGGGYLVRLHGRNSTAPPYGVVVDPGVDFVENLYRSGYALSDVDMVVLTHDHVDHIGALDPLLSLLHVRRELLWKEEQGENRQSSEGTRQIKVLMSRSVFQRYERVKQLHDVENPCEGEFEFVCFEDMKNTEGVLRLDSRKFMDWPEDFEIVAMRSDLARGPSRRNAHKSSRKRPYGHYDLSELPSHGLCFRTVDGHGPSLALTSDTPAPPSKEDRSHSRWKKIWAPALNSDVLIAHLGSVPVTELRRMNPVENALKPKTIEAMFEADATVPDDDYMELEAFQKLLQDANPDLQGQIAYAQWLRSHLPGKEKRVEGVSSRDAKLTERVPPGWLPPPDHNYLTGILAWAREYRDTRVALGAAGKRPGLFVIGELSEELGTMRGKVAGRLNEHIFKVTRERERGEERRAAARKRMRPIELAETGMLYALTGDIGLHLCIACGGEPGAVGDPSVSGQKLPSRVEVLCTLCNLDTDRAPEERYHVAHDVYEVCVKGENEGIFYNCSEHDPAHQEEPTFLEKLERFDIFGR